MVIKNHHKNKEIKCLNLIYYVDRVNFEMYKSQKMTFGHEKEFLQFFLKYYEN